MEIYHSKLVDLVSEQLCGLNALSYMIRDYLLPRPYHGLNEYFPIAKDYGPVVSRLLQAIDARIRYCSEPRFPKAIDVYYLSSKCLEISAIISEPFDYDAYHLISS